MPTLADLLTSKIPPHSLEAERAVLGGMLLDRESLPRAVELLKPADFYKEGHRKIFDAMLALFERNEPVDLLTISEELRRRSELDEVGGPASLGALVEEAATAAHLLSYGGIVREKAVLRDLIRIATEIIGKSYDGRDDVEKVLDDAERLIFQISERRDLLAERKRSEELEDRYGLMLRELQAQAEGDFIIIAGRPSMGKTAFAMNIAKYAGVRNHKRVLVLSLEMSKEQLVQRLLCAEGRVDSHKVRTGYLDTRDWTSLTNAAGRLAEAPIFIDDSPALSVLEARAKARRMKAEHGLDMIVIDYLQLMRGRSPENRQQEISEISRSLKALAKELDVPVVALSQLSRAVESRQSKEPQLSDLRESGALEQDADLILFLYRPDRYGLQKEEDERMADVIIGKQRNGPTGVVKLTFIPEYASFENRAEPDRVPQPF